LVVQQNQNNGIQPPAAANAQSAHHLVQQNQNNGIQPPAAPNEQTSAGM
jgi:hypothetical protein